MVRNASETFSEKSKTGQPVKFRIGPFPRAPIPLEPAGHKPRFDNSSITDTATTVAMGYS